MNVGELRELIKDLNDHVELYYPHYYKGYGLIPVSKLEFGEVEGKAVGVFDWKTLLLTDKNFISKPQEEVKEIVDRVTAE